MFAIASLGETPNTTIRELVQHSDLVIQGKIQTCDEEQGAYKCSLRVSRLFKGYAPQVVQLCGSAVSVEAPRLQTYSGKVAYFFLRDGSSCFRLRNNDSRSLAQLIDGKVYSSIDPYTLDGVAQDEFEQAIVKALD